MTTRTRLGSETTVRESTLLVFEYDDECMRRKKGRRGDEGTRLNVGKSEWRAKG